jgi:hydroxyacylglutathione hydrolase
MSTRGDFELEVFITEGLGDASYLIASGGEAAVVDPQRDAWRFVDAARRRDWRIRHVVETHAHNDYLSGALELRAAVGADIVAPALGAYSFAHRPADDGDSVTIGDLELVARATPGHTYEHLAWEVWTGGGTSGSPGSGGHPASAGSGGHPEAVFTGGSLLVGGAGRTDLVGPEATDTLTRAQYRSLRALARLPDTVRILPTHGGGSFCTANDGGGERTSTLGTERRSNPALAAIDEASFVRRQLEDLRRYPTYYAEMGRRNRAGPAVLGQVQGARPLTPTDIGDVRKRGAWIVDARPRDAFASAHVPGSLNVELGPDFATYVGWLVPFGSPIALVLPDPLADAWVEAVTQLLRIGYERVVGVLDGGMAAWTAAGLATRSYPVADMRALFDAWTTGGPVPLVDVRQPAEWATDGALEGSERVFVADVPARLGLLRDRGPWWVACASGQRASLAASVLDAAGVPVVLVGRQGIGEWVRRFARAGVPVSGGPAAAEARG